MPSPTATQPASRRGLRTPERERVSVPFVGLTGGLGAGKSTALETLGRLGAAVLSTDAVVHELYGNAELRQAVTARFGRGVLDDNGDVDRAAVARVVFADPAERAGLESLLWPAVGARVAAFRNAAGARTPPPPAIVVETPLLFEAGLEGRYDATIAVVADEEVRARRAAERGHASVDERAARQLTQQEKADRATYSVTNSGTIEELEAKLSEVLGRLHGT
jgi:dephospho-CoA kinase